jgi:D-tyrosyl-tRNA(Tyr) deacylase
VPGHFSDDLVNHLAPALNRGRVCAIHLTPGTLLPAKGVPTPCGDAFTGPIHSHRENNTVMRVLLQRVSEASVSVDGEVVGAIGQGFVALVGVGHADGEEQARWLANKVAGLRVFEDAEGKFNLSLADVGGSVLVVSQFTLYADARKGRRPSFVDAAPPEIAQPLVDRFADLLRGEGVPVEEGVFGAMMLVEIHNDGPVTIWLERE